MPLSIKEINIKNFGPLPGEINWKPGKLNLIYGKNETGKTFLVEFIIRSLFKAKSWQLRQLTAQMTERGKVVVQGLGDDLVDFYPSKKEKIEDFYSKGDRWIPPDFSKLLVVKGAEVELGDGKEADKIILKRYLSSKEILDNIENRIPLIIKSAKIENDTIVGKMQGVIRERERLGETLEKIESLFNEVNHKYLGGTRKLLEDEKSKLEDGRNQMEEARKYHAYTLSQELTQLDNKRKEIDDKEFEKLFESVTIYGRDEISYKAKDKQLEEAKEKSEHYQWARQAVEIYEKLLYLKTIKTALLAVLIIFVGAAGVFSFLNLPFAVVGCLVGVFLFGYFLVRKAVEAFDKGHEMKKLEEEYHKRFKEKLTGLPRLKEVLKNMETENTKRELLEKQSNQERIKLQQDEEIISKQVAHLIKKEIDPAQWDIALKQVRRERNTLNEKIQTNREELIKLDVDPSEYVTRKPSVEYNAKKFDEVKRNLEQKEEELKKIEDSQKDLKRRIFQETGYHSSVWAEVIQHLREKHDQTLGDLKSKTAEIAANIAVMEVIHELRQAEDEKIKKNLQLDIIKEPLKEVTDRYTGFRLENDNLYVSDPYNEFPLNDMSTGAKDQVFFALRMGFCSHILEQDRVFFIMDDAFQHSDWSRRPLLVNKMIDLAEEGWQILYFTMDDHIKSLFDKEGERLGNEYKHFELAEDLQRNQ
jgi:uncharacterized protein YhaN